MRRYLVLPWLCLLALGTAGADTFHFTYTGSLYSASGTLSATANGDGSFTATSGSGFYGGDAITLIANPNAPNTYTDALAYTYDDQLFPSAPSLLDYAGLLFSFDTTGPLGATEVNICGTFNCDNMGAYGSILSDSNFTSDAGRFTLMATAVPEPSTLAVLALGLLGLTTLKRRI